MPTGCTPLWEFIGLIWTTQIERWIFVPWRQCAAQRRCYWWCLCCNFWLCFIALIIFFVIVVAILIAITIVVWIVAFICEFLCILLVVASGRGTCLVFSAPPPATPPTNAPPTASAGGPYSGRLSQPVPMSAAASTDPEGAALTATWDFGDGASASGLSVTHAYANVGVFDVTVTVSDGTGTASAKTTANIVLIGGGPADPPVDTDH